MDSETGSSYDQNGDSSVGCSSTSTNLCGGLGISFDGLGISGIVNEFLNVASVMRNAGLGISLDLGYDISMTSPLSPDLERFPPWIDLIRCIRDVQSEAYNADLIKEAKAIVIGGTPISAIGAYTEIVRCLVDSLVGAFDRQRLRLLVVENGTLPDNPLFTEALFLAVQEYGTATKLSKFVLWRDHDLMWSTEPQLYGNYPYPGVRKPRPDAFIHYAVATDWMRHRLQAWASDTACHVISNRFISPTLDQHSPRSLRAAYAIPMDAYLIARCTRIIPQKCIERDLRLADEIQRRLESSGDHRGVFLFVTGPTRENEFEYERLRLLEDRLSIAGQVIWGGGLLPLNSLMSQNPKPVLRFSVADLLAEADVSSFLTSFDYEGFGNPPGEAMAMGVPFIATTYELYHEVYGRRGAVAPLLHINRNSSAEDPLPDHFVAWVLRILTDPKYREQIVRHNRAVCIRHFSLAELENQLKQMFPDAL